MKSNKVLLTLAVFLLGFQAGQARAGLDIAQYPLFAGIEIDPVVMLNLSVDSQLFFNAYPEYADLSGDGAPDLGYVHGVDYFGYFDAYKCYIYSSTSGRFVPDAETNNKFCSGDQWSGNFLNWLTMARIDTVRQILYGGKRFVDTPALTVLERTYLPNDAHSWVRFYDGDNLSLLTPYSSADAPQVTSPTPQAIVTGSRRGADDRFWMLTSGWTSNEVQLGDQLELTHPGHPGVWMRGVVIETDFGVLSQRVRIQITGSQNPNGISEALSGWNIINRTRRGISFCNTTIATGASHGTNALEAPPLLMVARGDYSLWTANERWQCRWREDITPGIPDRMRIHDRPFMNGNDVVSSGLWSNSDSPRRNQVRIDEFDVRVEVCKEGLIGTERCKAYGSDGILKPSDGILKPFGLLQEFGEDGAIRFGLMTGSFSEHVSGGVLRKNMGTFGDEVDPNSGVFDLPADSIVRSLDALRIYGYSHNSGEYTAGDDNCVFGTSKAQMINGRCFSWGNPQAEIFAESLRYLAGLEPNDDFTHTGNDRIPGLQAAEWNNPVTAEEWCTPQTVIQFNASVTSYDNNAQAAASGLPGLGTVAQWTNTVGTGEGLAGSQVFFGGATGICTAGTLGNLSDFIGICPEAPNQDGTYHIAGLAHYAYMNDLRPDWNDVTNVRTIGVSLAPAVPRIAITRPGEIESSVTILPACDNRGDNLRCQMTDFRIVEQDLDAGTGTFFIQWDVAEWGADNDMDINGTLRYRITDEQILVSTQVWADSSGRETGFGYIISGTDNDGFHAHSGINSYTRTGGSGVPSCNNCSVGDAPSTATFQLGSGAAELLREPLYYAAKWAGFDKDLDFPNDVESWDQDGDGMPDNYFFAINPAELRESLAAAFELVLSDGSATSLASDSTRLETGTYVYQASFNTDDWSGQLIALDPNEDNEVIWRGADTLAEHAQNLGTRASRVFTYDPDSGLSGQGHRIRSTYVRERLEGLNNLPAGSYNIDDLVDYLIGDSSNEQRFGGPFRNRSSILGDIVNSQIVLSGARNEGWWRLGGTIGDDYLDHVEAKVDSERSVIFVGANDGMLHAFDGKTGAPYFSYLPSAVLDNAPEYADPEYGHRFFVDGQISVADAYLPDRGGWRTILVGAMAAGGKGVFALDVTNPGSFGMSDVLWEFTDQRNDIDDNIGHVYGTPTITRMSDGTWVSIIGNGYNNANGIAGLVIINLATGQTVSNGFVEVNIQGQQPDFNGLSSPALWLETGRQRHVERAYAGDLTGRIWRFDLDGSQPRLTTEFARGQLFRAQAGSGNNAPGQPITVSPTVAASPSGGLWVLVGTGKLIENSDVLIGNNPNPDTFYALLDRNAAVPRNQLGEVEIGIDADTGLRTAELVDDETGPLGWFADMSAGANTGERVLARADILFGRVIFSTFEPVGDPCLGGGISRSYVLNATTGHGELGGSGGCPTCAGAVIPDTGAPVAPPTVIRPPTPAVPGDGTPSLPGLPPMPGDDPEEPPTPPDDGAVGARTDWCSEFGYINPTNLSFVSLGRVCDGRQTWRQVR